jgi:hypothetical protein
MTPTTRKRQMRGSTTPHVDRGLAKFHYQIIALRRRQCAHIMQRRIVNHLHVTHRVVDDAITVRVDDLPRGGAVRGPNRVNANLRLCLREVSGCKRSSSMQQKSIAAYSQYGSLQFLLCINESGSFIIFTQNHTCCFQCVTIHCTKLLVALQRTSLSCTYPI